MGVSRVVRGAHRSEGFIPRPRTHGEPDPRVGYVQVQHMVGCHGGLRCILVPSGVPPHHMDRVLRHRGTPGQDGAGWAGGDGYRGRAAAKASSRGSLPAAEPNSQCRGCRAGARLPGTPHSGHPRGPGAPGGSVPFPQLCQSGFSARAGSRPGRRSRSPSPLYPAVLAAGVFPSLPFPDVTESPPKLTPSSLPRSRGSSPNLVLPPWALLP